MNGFLMRAIVQTNLCPIAYKDLLRAPAKCKRELTPVCEGWRLYRVEVAVTVALAVAVAVGSLLAFDLLPNNWSPL
jgi:hypothetical protein